MLQITTHKQNASLLKELNHFLDEMPFAALAATLAEHHKLNAAEIHAKLDTYANESRMTFALIQHHLHPHSRILEVGAGLCMTSLFLKQQGYNITALEPAIGGFDLFAQIKQAILEHYSQIALPVLDIPVQQLCSDNDGCFDLVFSNNVIEHIPGWPAAFDAMSRVLSADGIMLHACPNYTVPYEPHYGVPVFRHFRGISKALFLSADSDDDIWNSLNFITCRELATYCKQHRLQYAFEEALLYNALKRIEDDPLFATRHQGMVATAARFVMRSGLGAVIKHIPPCMATPMVVKISKRKLP
ncbi:MAG: methyltransferase domain-containing protein [Mariprofundus sp.]